MADVAVIVPVMRRPANAAPFMTSLRATTDRAQVYAVADEADTDTIDAWADTGAVVLTGPLTTFAEKVNHAYRQTREPWLFPVGDDVHFHARWLEWALLRAAPGAAVIGTNDLGNARVMAGQHATHMLVARSYVDELGASWDGPGVVCHEGYRHGYVDDEMVAAAKMRGVWAMALDSHVEHLHPVWGKGPSDDVYLLGISSIEEDGDHFTERVERFVLGAA